MFQQKRCNYVTSVYYSCLNKSYLKNKKIFQKIKKTPKGRFLYKYFFNVQFAYSSGAVNCVHRYITLFKYVVVKK